MNKQPTVAVLGLGAMGHAFAANVLKSGLATRVWNRTRSRGEDLADAGAIVRASPAEAVREADVVLTMLPDGPTTRTVLLGSEGALAAMKPHAVLAQMGTLGVKGTEELIAAVRQARDDIVFIDAPVSGTKTPAENAQVLVLAIGDRQAAAAVEPVFAAIAKGTRWLGPAGAGSRMKLVVNAWLITMMQGIAESTQLAATLGFSPDDLWDVLEGGPLAAPYVKGKLDMIKQDNYCPQMALIWGLKDARQALKAADSRNLPGLQRISDVWQQAVDAGHGESDISVIYRYLAP
ncbi:NAD(P)-dependent oxidoreductase [Candidatus Sodalis endolongispinus]|uniref:NAD(P)-dependent oxidoreductase n=1 Tax=Candidatus Sodalis endolongispinus TaxID=2812662 RepID=A0ABS5YBE1_9GAMM|nr:NAD(P)-dependent oxidoreductase [Candidatus Sodalis endolongispinus]MBT9431865.1 NAD(P)-dependent oxidoreductase [Candidatus Sodalis endolongispinus]